MPINPNQDARLLVGLQIAPGEETKLYSRMAAISSKIPPLRLRTQGNLPLGRLSKQADEFQSSLAAANSRVVGFAAAAGSLYAVSRAFQAIVKNTIEVEKSLADINAALQVSTTSLSQFSGDLFNVANKTGNSFKTAAAAALEFSRQGLGMEETLRRVHDALSLTRFTGLAVEESVTAITTALNSFNDVGLTSASILDKIASVDVAYAVSGRDLAQGLTRVASIAKDAGVEFDKLLGLLTSARQISGRTGEVIGTAVGTIIQRIGRGDTRELLEQIGVATEDMNGNFLNADIVLTNLSKTWDTLTDSQRSAIGQTVGGIRQQNILRALMSDLSKENSIFTRATLESANATGFAAQRNEELNKTLSASVNEFLNNITKVSAGIGNLSIAPGIRKVTEIFNNMVSSFNKNDNLLLETGEGIGNGILHGLGNYLSGPGLFTIGALALKLFGTFASFAGKSFLSILEASSKQYQVTQAINGLLAQQPQLLAAITSGALSETKVQEQVLNLIRQQNIALAQRGQAAQAVRGLVNTGVLSVSGGNVGLGGGTRRIPRFGKDLDKNYKIPNFANPLFSAISREIAAGIPKSLIRVGNSPKLQSGQNPAGLGVFNLRDEPQGLNQGINRVLSQGRNPKTSGIPNFAPQLFANVPETIRDPFNRPPGTALLDPNKSILLEREVEKFKEKIKAGVITQESLNKRIKDLGNTFNLTDDSLKQVGRRLQSSLSRFEKENPQILRDRFFSKGLPTGRSQTTFERQDAFNRLRASVTPSRGGLSNEDLTRRAEERRRILLQRRQQEAATLQASNRLQDLESRAGIFTRGGRAAARDLRRESPDAFRQFENRLQNRAFLASIVGPILGGVAQQAIGDRSVGARGVGQSAAGLGNIAGFAATGFALGGGVPGAVAGGAIGTILELPKVIKAFSDTLPDLQRRLGELQDISQKTSASLGGYIDVSEKLDQVYRGLTDGLTKGQLKQLEVEQQKLLTQIPDPNLRKRIEGLISSRDFSGAREQQGSSAVILQQSERLGKLLESSTLLADDLKSLDVIKARAFSGLREQGAGFTEASIFAQEAALEERSKKERRDVLEAQASQFKSSIVGLTSEKLTQSDRGFLDVLAEPQNIQALAKVPRGNFEELGKVIQTIGSAADVDIKKEDLDFVVQSLSQLSKFAPELGRNFQRFFSESGIREQIELPKKLNDAGKGFQKALVSLNQSLLESQKRFNALGTSIEIAGIQKLGELTANLRSNEIRRGTSNQISLLRGGGEGLRSFFDFQESSAAISNRTNLAREELRRGTGQQVIENIENIRGNIGKSLVSALQDDFRGNEAGLQKEIESRVKGFDSAFKPFVDRLNEGEPVTGQFLRSLSSVAESQLRQAERTKDATQSSRLFVDNLIKLSQGVEETVKSFTTSRAKINTEELSNQNIARTQFQQNARLLGERRAVNLENLRTTGNFDVSQISRQAQLSRSSLGQGFRNRIEISNLQEFETNIASLFREAINNPAFGGELNNRNIRGAGDLTGLIDEQSRIVSELQGTGQTEELTKQEDKLNALLDLQEKISNLDKIRLENIKQQTIEEEKLLRFAVARITEQRRINEENAREGNFQSVRENLGKTFTETLSFTSNDYFNELSKNVADFGEDFKGAFKQGFAEMATGVKTAGDAFRSIGLNIAGSILSKASGLATDTLLASLLGSQKVGGGSGLLAGLFTNKNSGGLILPKKYARGGYVDMGSGVRDDVPALLSGGEFVINKRATSRLGKSTLDILNEEPERARDIIKTSSGSELNALLANEFFGTGSKTRPTSGSLNASPLLSDIALTDENNPQNALRFSRERYFFDLKQYQNDIRKSRNEFEKKQLTSLYSAYISAGVNFAGSQIGSGPRTAEDYNKLGREFGDLSGGGDFYNSGRTGFSIGRAMGGLIPKKYNFGGNVFGGNTKRDNLPAFLTGGEYVFNKSASNKIGLNNLNYMNKRGEFPGFANGGQVGDDYISTKGNNNTKNQESFTPFISINNQITVTLNENGNVSTSSNTQTSDNRKNNKEDKNEQGKQIGTLVQSIVTNSLVRESKAGGLLYERFKTK